jgi:hypothetical protein
LEPRVLTTLDEIARAFAGGSDAHMHIEQVPMTDIFQKVLAAAGQRA